MLGVLHIRIKQAEQARETALSALASDDDPIRVCKAVTILAQAGFPREAGRQLRGISTAHAPAVLEKWYHRASGEVALAQSQLAKAIQEFGAAANLEAQAVPKEYLARMYVVTGQSVEAIRLYVQILHSAPLIWTNPDWELPGLWGDSAATLDKLLPSDHLEHAAAHRITAVLRPTSVRQ
jgi:hypothetical protein